MTTIVYKDGILAADTRAFSGDHVPIGEKQKIHQVRFADGGLWTFGVSTPVPGFSEAIKRWYMSEKSDDMLPDVGERGFYMLEIAPNGEVTYFKDSFDGSGPLEAPYFAIGSGCEYALGALSTGADAITAVRVAAEHDPWTGGRVVHLIVPGPQPEIEDVEVLDEAA